MRSVSYTVCVCVRVTWLLQVFGDGLGAVVVSPGGVSGGNNRGPGRKAGHDAGLGQAHRLLLHGLQQGLLLAAQLVELIDTAQPCRDTHMRTQRKSREGQEARGRARQREVVVAERKGNTNDGAVCAHPPPPTKKSKKRAENDGQEI